jgi:hypothetical protein
MALAAAGNAFTACTSTQFLRFFLIATSATVSSAFAIYTFGSPSHILNDYSVDNRRGTEKSVALVALLSVGRGFPMLD